MTGAVALAQRAETWATEYAAGAAGPAVYAATVGATGLDPLQARHLWDVVARWEPWGVSYEGHAIRSATRRGR